MESVSDNPVPTGLEKGKNFAAFESCASASLDERVSQRSTARADLNKIVSSHKIPEVITVDNNDNIIHEIPKDTKTTDKVPALTIDESTPVGDRMDVPKKASSIRISSFNPNGLNKKNLQIQLQHAMDLDIDIQGFSDDNWSDMEPMEVETK